MSSTNNKVLYVGVTNNMERRMSEHKVATFGTHVGHYNIKKLIALFLRYFFFAGFRREIRVE